MRPASRRIDYRSLLLPALLITALGCRTVAPDADEPEAAPASTAQQAWQNLIARRDATPAASALVRLHIPGSPTLRARVSHDAAGSVEIAVLTPLGTEAIDIFARPSGDTFVLDEIHQSYWRGSFADVAGVLHLPDTTAQQFFWLAVGLPSPGNWVALESASPSEARYQMPGFVAIAGQTGLLEVRLPPGKRAGSTGKVVRYEGARFPPDKVSFADGAGSEILRLEVLDFTEGASVGEPAFTTEWERVDDLDQLFN